MNKLWILLLLSAPAMAQVSYSSINAQAPPGSCTTGTLPAWIDSAGNFYTCKAGVPTTVGGSGTFNALSGDATSTATGGATTVVGLKGGVLPALAAGFLNYTGTAWALTAPFTLTTTGTSGAATFSGGTLNIPQYAGGGGSGTVTSVAQTVPSWLTVGGSPVTTSGTLAITATTGQTAHQVIGTCGAATSFAPCALVAGDIPTLNQNTSGTAANLSGTPALPNGTTATTQTVGDNTTKLATTAFVLANAGSSGVSGQASGVIPLGSTATTIAAQSHIDDGVTTAATLTATEPLVVNASGNGVSAVEGTAPSGVASSDVLYPDSTAHRWKMNNNNGGAVQVVASGADINTSDQVTVTHLASALPVAQGGTGQTSGTVTFTVASGTSAMGTGAITSGTCATVVTTSATGTATTDSIIATPNADPTAVTGYAVSATGSLYIVAYPTANNVNFKVCNNTGGSLTPAALTMNWRVVR